MKNLADNVVPAYRKIRIENGFESYSLEDTLKRFYQELIFNETFTDKIDESEFLKRCKTAIKSLKAEDVSFVDVRDFLGFLNDTAVKSVDSDAYPHLEVVFATQGLPERQIWKLFKSKCITREEMIASRKGESDKVITSINKIPKMVDRLTKFKKANPQGMCIYLDDKQENLTEIIKACNNLELSSMTILINRQSSSSSGFIDPKLNIWSCESSNLYHTKDVITNMLQLRKANNELSNILLFCDYDGVIGDTYRMLKTIAERVYQNILKSKNHIVS